MLDPSPEQKPWLLFKKPDFQPGVNVTVRRGNKWLNRAPAESIVEVRQSRSDGTLFLFDAFIIESLWMKICDIPVDVLAQEADAGCRTHEGLLAEMNRRGKVTPRDYVTVLVFEQCDPDPGEHDDPNEYPKVH